MGHAYGWNPLFILIMLKSILHCDNAPLGSIQYPLQNSWPPLAMSKWLAKISVLIFVFFMFLKFMVRGSKIYPTKEKIIKMKMRIASSNLLILHKSINGKRPYFQHGMHS